MSTELAPQNTTSTTESAPKAGAKASSRLKQLLVASVLLKLVLLLLFSSAYENELFIPFLKYYVNNSGNPWEHFYSQGGPLDAFPYQPLMLYILSLALAPLEIFGWDNVLVRNFFFKLPTLASDLAIAYFLFRMFPGKWRHVFWFYFLSPIVLYACYMHSQVDLIPTALLFAGFYYLRESKWLPAFILSGLALSTKLHVLAAFPIIAIYLYRNRKYDQVFSFAVISSAVYLFMVLPYFNSAGFQHMVLSNPKQSRVFEVFYQIGDLKLYLPILATIIAYGRFALYSKINTDLLDAFLALVFSVIVMLIVPSPGWYVWMTPFLSVFLIKHYRHSRQLLAPFIWLNFFYLVYFIFFDRPDHIDLIFIDKPMQAKIYSDTLRGLVFTLLEAGLLSNIVLCYRAGVKSNAIYKRDQAVVIGIGGDSAAGKTTLLSDLMSMLKGKVVQLEGDADHKWERGDERWQHLTHLDPKANFLHRQAETVFALKRGKSVVRSEYDHSTGQFTSPHIIEPNDFIIISGLHTFYLPKMRKLTDLKIFMDPQPEVHDRWKVMRDKEERGYSEEEVRAQMEKRRPDSDRFIQPQKEFADMVVHYFIKDGDDEENEGKAAQPRGNAAQPRGNAGQQRGNAAQDGGMGGQQRGNAVQDGGNSGSAPDLCLKVELSSSIHIENLVEALRSAQAPIFWDYSQDLARQEITVFRPVDPPLLSRLAQELIANLGELINGEIVWQPGHRGFVQLLVLIYLSELMREREDTDAV